MKKHGSLSDEDLSSVIQAATQLDEQERIQKEKRRREGRETAEDLPAGHPMRVAMERAREQFEQRQEFEKQQHEAVERMKARRAKRAQKRHSRRAAEDSADKASQKAAGETNRALDELAEHTATVRDEVGKLMEHMKEVNGSIDALATHAAEVGGTVQVLEKDLIGGAMVKATRLQRLLLATHRGLTTSKLNDKRIERDGS